MQGAARAVEEAAAMDGAYGRSEITTAIGRMDDLARYNEVDDVDTWWKSGRIPGPGEAQVTWLENQQWLDERIQRGDAFVLVTNPANLSKYAPGVPTGAFTLLELQYLEKRGIQVFHSY